MASKKSKPLWNADDQHVRLAELIANSDEPAKDNPLRRDVRSLGAILGQVLVEQSGQELFDSVEELRRLLIEHRETARQSPEQSSAPELMLKAQEIVSRMDLTQAYQITKAFATYSNSPIWPRPTTASAAGVPANWIVNMLHSQARFVGPWRA